MIWGKGCLFLYLLGNGCDLFQKIDMKKSERDMEKDLASNACNKVERTFLCFLQKRLEGLTEAELEALLEQVEEETQRQASGEQVN
ncbi:hypothetical protein Gotur_003560 [Gossypium turneri]